MTAILHHIVIAEKQSIAHKIACALCTQSPCEFQYCPYYSVDIFIHHLALINKYQHPISMLRCRANLLNGRKDINYFSGVEADESSVSMIYSSQVDGPQYGNVLKSVEELLTRWDIPRYPKPVVEKVDWYDINPGYENARWLIVHTNGNPFRSDIRKSQGNTKLPFTSTDPKVIRNEMNHIPKHSGSGSSRMRCQFLSKVLNTNNRIDRVYVATDMDVAGSYTASLLPGFNRLSNIKEIQRVRLNNTTPEGIRAAIKSAFPFDWHNAEAGRLRATIDFVIGRGFFKVIEDVSSFQQVPTKISLGRTRLLALDCLYRRWREAQTWQGSGNIYMVFIGLGDEHSISEQLRRGAFLSVALKTMRGSFSPAGLLIITGQKGDQNHRIKRSH